MKKSIFTLVLLVLSSVTYAQYSLEKITTLDGYVGMTSKYCNFYSDVPAFYEHVFSSSNMDSHVRAVFYDKDFSVYCSVDMDIPEIQGYKLSRKYAMCDFNWGRKCLVEGVYVNLSTEKEIAVLYDDKGDKILQIDASDKFHSTPVMYSTNMCYLNGCVYLLVRNRDSLYNATTTDVYKVKGVYNNTSISYQETNNYGNAKIMGIYDMNGIKQNDYVDGMNIVRYSDDSVKKIMK